MQLDLTKYSPKELSKIIFISNAIDDGWTVKKRDELYIFSRHKGKEKQIYEEKYLDKFIKKYFKMN
tara:strand:- start:215 stop:412 length:198 start_codon:yes stop_codon:yes gene_type:complete